MSLGRGRRQGPRPFVRPAARETRDARQLGLVERLRRARRRTGGRRRRADEVRPESGVDRQDRRRLRDRPGGHEQPTRLPWASGRGAGSRRTLRLPAERSRRGACDGQRTGVRRSLGHRRGHRRLSALHRPRNSRRAGGTVARLAEAAARGGRTAERQQRRRRHKLRDAGDRSALPRLRSGAAARRADGRPRREGRRTLQGAQPEGDGRRIHARSDHARHCRRRTARRVGRRDGRPRRRRDGRLDRHSLGDRRLRSAGDPRHGAAAGAVQPVAVSLRARRRSCPHGLGQPPLCGTDPASRRRRAVDRRRRRWRRH